MGVVSVILAILPLAVASLASSVPIATTVSLITSPTRRPAALPYMIGSVVGLLVTTLLFTTSLTSLLPLPQASASPLFGVGQVVAGALLIAGGIGRFVWKRRPAARDRPPQRRGILSEGTPRPRVALLFGLLFSLRPKALFLATAVGVIVTGAQIGGLGTVVVAVVYVIIGSSNVTAPVLFDHFFSETSAGVIVRVTRWFDSYGAIVALIATAGTGLFLVVRGMLVL